jgi:signal transduction histidine kinase
LRALRRLVGEWRAQLDRGLDLRQTQSADASIAYLRLGRGIVTMGEALSALEIMSAEETRLLARRRGQEQLSLSRNFHLIVSLCIAAGILLITMLLRIQREMTARALAVRQLDERSANLAEATVRRTRFLSAASHELRQPLHSLSLLNAAFPRPTDQPAGASDCRSAEELARGDVGPCQSAVEH